jgi:hypothetical protein
VTLVILVRHVGVSAAPSVEMLTASGPVLAAPTNHTPFTMTPDIAVTMKF